MLKALHLGINITNKYVQGDTFFLIIEHFEFIWLPSKTKFVMALASTETKRTTKESGIVHEDKQN